MHKKFVWLNCVTSPTVFKSLKTTIMSVRASVFNNGIVPVHRLVPTTNAKGIKRAINSRSRKALDTNERFVMLIK